jgi:F0F1-type ATP synthase assembly protein I
MIIGLIMGRMCAGISSVLQAAKVYDDERTTRAKVDMERYSDLLLLSTC